MLANGTIENTAIICIATNKDGANVHLGIWLSRGVWQHKCEEGCRTQAWNLPQLPDNFVLRHGQVRLYVAIRGYWRGYFVVKAFSWNIADRSCPYVLLFDPASWTAILPVRAPARRGARYTVDVPEQNAQQARNGGNEIDSCRYRREGNEKEERNFKRNTNEN